MPWMAPAAVIGGSALGSLINKGGAEDAARAQGDATKNALQLEREQWQSSRNDLAPYREAGQAALGRLRSLLGIDTETSNPSESPLLRKFAPDDLNSDTVYNSGLQFGLDEGRKAIERRAAAGGGYDSGATLKALTRFGNDYGSTKAADAYGRFRDYQDSTYGKLSGIAGLGSGATNVGVGANNAAASNMSNLITGQGNANAAASIARSNALSGGINNAIGYSYLSSLSPGGQRTPPPPAGDPNLVGGAN